MHIEAVIDMRNPNALISMAYISENNENPYAVFCEYIKYCLFKNSSDTVSFAEIGKSVSKEFGIMLPHNVLLRCLDYLKKDGAVIESHHQVKRLGSFDIIKFDERRFQQRKAEQELIDRLRQFAERYNRVWSEEYAREQLIKMLDDDGFAFSFSVGEGFAQDFIGTKEPLIDVATVSEESGIHKPVYEDRFFTGRFIEQIIIEDGTLKDYLQSICAGLMICIGAYQLPPEKGNSFPAIKGTNFFFDTRLLLRYLGCAGDAAVKATRELVEIIQDAGGIIYYYPHTYEEIYSAFSDALISLKKGGVVQDYEMRSYLNKCKNRLAILQAKLAIFEQELESKNIHIMPMGSYSDRENIQFGFDRLDLEAYMKRQLPWDDRTVENDAASIWETHMRRCGNYKEYCGTKARLPVFVTSNTKLVSIALEYKDARSEVKNIKSWNQNRLPVITDIRLTCRLWSPAKQGAAIPLLRLAANAAAAQRPTQKYLETIQEFAEKFTSQSPRFSQIGISAFYDDRITDLLLEETKGAEENFTIDCFANSIEEVLEKEMDKKTATLRQQAEQDRAELELKIEERNSQIYDTQQKLESVNSHIVNQQREIIAGPVDKYRNKLGCKGILLRLVISWKWIVPVIVAGGSAAASYFAGNLHPFWVVAIPTLAALAEKLTASNFITKWMLQYVLPVVENSFIKKVKKELRGAEKNYEDEIIRCVTEETKLLVQAKKIINK